MDAGARRRARRAAVATAVVFATNGALYGNWVTRIPAVRDHVHADAASLGLALLCLGGGSLLSMPTTSALVRRYGSRTVVIVASVFSGAAFTVAGAVPSVWTLGAALACTGLTWGVWDVAMNVQGHLAERRLDRPLMPRYHACWSAGGIAGSGAGALVAGARAPVVAHFAVAAVVLVAACIVATTWFLDDRGQGTEPVPADGPRPAGAWHAARRVLDRRLLALGLLVLCATVTEGAATDWLTLYFTDQRGAVPAAAASAFTTFSVAMATGRFLGTSSIERLGRARALRLTAFVATAGIAATLVLPGLAGGYVGAALWGFGVSIVFPAGVSAAGDAGPRPADAIAAVTTIGYAGFLVGPPMIGFLARAYGLGNALWAVAVLAAGIALLAPAARSRTRR